MWSSEGKEEIKVHLSEVWGEGMKRGESTEWEESGAKHPNSLKTRAHDFYAFVY
jgi:hypothetical protein